VRHLRGAFSPRGGRGEVPGLRLRDAGFPALLRTSAKSRSRRKVSAPNPPAVATAPSPHVQPSPTLLESRRCRRGDFRPSSNRTRRREIPAADPRLRTVAWAVFGVSHPVDLPHDDISRRQGDRIRSKAGEAPRRRIASSDIGAFQQRRGRLDWGLGGGATAGGSEAETFSERLFAEVAVGLGIRRLEAAAGTSPRPPSRRTRRAGDAPRRPAPPPRRSGSGRRNRPPAGGRPGPPSRSAPACGGSRPPRPAEGPRRRALTSTKTRVPPSRATKSISPKRVRQRRSTTAIPAGGWRSLELRVLRASAGLRSCGELRHGAKVRRWMGQGPAGERLMWAAVP